MLSGDRNLYIEGECETVGKMESCYGLTFLLEGNLKPLDMIWLFLICLIGSVLKSCRLNNQSLERTISALLQSKRSYVLSCCNQANVYFA